MDPPGLFREVLLCRRRRHGTDATMAKLRMDLTAFVGKLIEEHDG